MSLMEEFNSHCKKIVESFENMAVRLPHLFVKEGLSELSEEDLNALTQDFQLWIEQQAEIFQSETDEKFGVPLASIFELEDSTIGCSCEEEHAVRFQNSGFKISEFLMKMIYSRFREGDESYFRRYHRVVCIRKCLAIQECYRIRELVVERLELEEELEMLRAKQRIKQILGNQYNHDDDSDDDDPPAPPAFFAPKRFRLA